MKIQSLHPDLGRQILRFCLVGIGSTIVNYLVFFAMYSLLLGHYLLSASIGFISGVFVGFAFNRRYTFDSKRNIPLSLSLYFLVYGFTLAVNLLLLYLMVTYGHFTPLIGNALLLPITVLLNFIGTKVIAFDNRIW